MGIWLSENQKDPPNVVNGQRLALKQGRALAPIPPQAIPGPPDSPVILQMVTEVAESFGPGIYFDLTANQYKVDRLGVYNIWGYHSLELAANDEVRLFLYLNGNLGSAASGAFVQGRGAGKPIPLSYNINVTLQAGDVVDIRAIGESSPVSLTVDTTTFGMARTMYDPTDISGNDPF